MSSQRDQRVLLYDLRRELEIIKTRLIGLEYQNSVLEFQLNQAEIQVFEVSLDLEDSVESRDEALFERDDAELQLSQAQDVFLNMEQSRNKSINRFSRYCC